MNKPAVALIGALGHGVWHRRSMHRLASEGRIRIAGLSARRPIVDAPDAPIDGISLFTDYQVMLRETRPDVVIICTPPHTHLTMAREVFAIGADLLLEKPPVPTVEEHHKLCAEIEKSGRLCQINFQALGSAALTEICDLVTSDALGAVSTVDAVGAWWRPDTYFTRSAWSGKRMVDGNPVMDGALVNPFAHAVMQAMAVADAAGGIKLPVKMDLERYRSRDIETEDVACMRLTYATGLETMVAVTLASSTFLAGEIVTTGSKNTAILEYPKDRVKLPGQTEWSEPRNRVGMLENLLDHRGDPAVPLIAPLTRTEPFTVVAEAIVAAPDPTRIGEQYLSEHPDGTGKFVVGIEDLMRRVVAERKLPSELSVPWATEAHTVVLGN